MASPFRRPPGSSPYAALTICALNYFAQASVLVNTWTRLHPEIAIFVVVADEKDAAFAAAHADLNIVWVEALGVPGFAHCAMKFDIIELSTDIKAHALLGLLGAFERVIYLDPDVCVYHRLDAVFEALGHAPDVVTPATMTPILDGHQPDDIDHLRVGAFNLGFIGVNASPTGQAFLRWWSSRCLSDGFHDTPTGVFLDQKWLDLAACFFPGVEILRDPGLNMASWNLHERRLTCVSGTWLVNHGPPLKFFHFSSFDPHRPRQVARRQTRYAEGERTDLQPLLDAYAEAVLTAGFDVHSARAYSFDRFRSGEYISPTLRRLYANAHYSFPADEDPREAGSALHRFGVSKRLVRSTLQPARRATAADLKDHGRSVRFLAWMFALALRLLGPNRYFLLMRYLAQAASIRRQPRL